MKNILLTLIIALFSFFSFAQNEWTLYKNIEGVKIYSKDSDCYPKDGMAQTAVLFRFENTTNRPLTIDWRIRVWYNGEENTKNIGSEENHYYLTLDSMEIKKGNCELKNNMLFLYKKFLKFEKSSKLTRFELDDLNVIDK